jgi:hypothetical protein
MTRTVWPDEDAFRELRDEYREEELDEQQRLDDEHRAAIAGQDRQKGEHDD